MSTEDLRSVPPTAPLRPSRRPLVGALLALIGTVHVAATPLVYPDGVRSILDSRIIASIEADPEVLALRSTVFWYVTAGLMIIVTSSLVIRIERRTGHVPQSLGWALLGISTWGVVLMPVSGFWALVAPAALALRRSPNRDRRRSR